MALDAMLLCYCTSNDICRFVTYEPRYLNKRHVSLPRITRFYKIPVLPVAIFRFTIRLDTPRNALKSNLASPA